MHNTRIVLPVASTIARAEICLGCGRDRPFLNRTHSGGFKVGGLEERLKRGPFDDVIILSQP